MPAHAEAEHAPHEAQQIVRGGGRALADLREEPGGISRGDLGGHTLAERRQQIFIEVTSRHLRVLETPRIDLRAVPILGEIAKRLARLLGGDRGPLRLFGLLLGEQRITPLVEHEALLPRLDPRRGETHVGEVAEGHPAFAAGEAIAEHPRGTLARLLPEVEAIAVAEQHRTAEAVCALDRKRVEFSGRHVDPRVRS